jgi:hypothetical protein
MKRCYSIRNGGNNRLIAKRHDALLLMLFPLKEGFAGSVDVKLRIVGFSAQFANIVGLIADTATLCRCSARPL